jgi:hypothetical protein
MTFLLTDLNVSDYGMKVYIRTTNGKDINLERKGGFLHGFVKLERYEIEQPLINVWIESKGTNFKDRTLEEIRMVNIEYVIETLSKLTKGNSEGKMYVFNLYEEWRKLYNIIEGFLYDACVNGRYSVSTESIDSKVMKFFIKLINFGRTLI